MATCNRCGATKLTEQPCPRCGGMENGKYRPLAARRRYKFQRQNGACHWCHGPMTLEYKLGKNGEPNLPRNYATFEHLQKRRDGGAGKPNNVVMACLECNCRREDGTPGHYTPPMPENLAAWSASNDELRAKLIARSYTPKELAEIYSRGLLPNWPMWSKQMAAVPLGNP